MSRTAVVLPGRRYGHAQAGEGGATVVELPGADHGFEVPGDPVASAETLVALTRAVLAFVT